MILSKNHIEETLTRWYSKSMKIRAFTRKQNNERALAYYAARSYVHLPFQSKFNVGFQMGICDEWDAMRTEDALDEHIFRQVIHNKRLTEFMQEVNRVKYESI